MTRGPGAPLKSVNGFENEVFTPRHGWPDDVVAPSTIAYKDKNVIPRGMSHSEIQSPVASWREAVKRAVRAGFDAIEIHGAHGYLIHDFLSPVSNKRTDEYGGSLETRIRLAVQLVDVSRQNMPEDMALFFCISGMEKDPRKKIVGGPGYQAPAASQVKKQSGDRLLVGTVGAITSGPQANDLLNRGLDLVLIGRMFQKNPGLVWAVADDLDVDIKSANQIHWVFAGCCRK
ncbi:hypothetical protein N7448_001721 [Penicillium atrosanguineum]|uniref:Peptidoglycan-binding Lysin subgroup n=1 Tax=Penicillium atrosanguineum TaxID=1132637 RepID=UPI00239D4E01|nr:Peptidoglycan-binding Lysin subgroup [Penicillium atrosanguineum]KAJ5133250.1 hypothetical protein N7526_004615 [Penicillium atrosanguineum]KAJ5150143.1 hypothetical protein N7448_001721 [Penicillium atrosanguineum]KAJ5305457.1 Peptidoglycan-binding Lysin subgroup [Penicillium atrosanguineum]